MATQMSSSLLGARISNLRLFLTCIAKVMYNSKVQLPIICHSSTSAANRLHLEEQLKKSGGHLPTHERWYVFIPYLPRPKERGRQRRDVVRNRVLVSDSIDGAWATCCGAGPSTFAISGSLGLPGVRGILGRHFVFTHCSAATLNDALM